MKPKVSVIIVSFKVKDLLRKCLEDLTQEAEKISLEIIVIDNASSDGTVEMLTHMQKSWQALKIIINDKNVGFAKACNQGIKEASGDYILLLNPDTEVSQGTLQALTNYLDEHPEIGVLGCKLVFPDGSLQSLGEKFSSAWEIFKEQVLFSKTWRRFLWHKAAISGGFREVDYVSGACLMTRRDIIRNVGLFKEDYFMYGEDLEFCYRVKQAGWRVGVLTGVKVIHLHSKSTEQNLSEVLFHSVQNSIRNVASLYGRKRARLGFIFYIVGLSARAILAIFRQNKTPKDYLRCIKKLLSARVLQEEP